jgi:hypothetical protein
MLRTLHAYVGAFIAPSVLFFATTGALQLFTLHEAHGNYEPAPFVQKLGMLHKDQAFVLKPHSDSPAINRHDAAPRAAANEKGPSLSAMALKWFFLVIAGGLATSTGLGLWMGLAQSPRKRLILALFLAGAAIPLVLALSGAN